MLNPGHDALDRFWHARVAYTAQGQIEAVVHYLDSWYEIETSLLVRPRDYRVSRAGVIVVRTPGGKEGTYSGDLEALSGAIAYAGIGKRIAVATATDATGLIGGLLVENVKALRQARLFVWDREGIDPAEQLPLIEKLLSGSCIYFSRPGALESVVSPVQLREMRRWDCLFTRHRYCLMRRDGGEERVTAGLSDSYHEMQLEVGVREDTLTSLKGRILRAPHDPCFDAEVTHGRLLGARPSEGPSGWEKRLTGPGGCTHLADVAREACSSLLYWRATRGWSEPAQEAASA
jgi:hypothetical protein